MMVLIPWRVGILDHVSVRMFQVRAGAAGPLVPVYFLVRCSFYAMVRNRTIGTNFHLGRLLDIL